MPIRQKRVEELERLLYSQPSLKEALVTSLQKAAQPGLETLEDFYNFLDSILTHIPSESDLMPSVRQFYFVISHSPGDMLKKDDAFNQWMQDFVVTRGDFLDTRESVATLDTYINNPEYNIDDYIQGPSGWQTYNQFLARQLKPGRRPVAGLCDDSTIVSPADSQFKGQWQIEDNSSITVKGTSYSIVELLGDSMYKEKFKDGIFTHSFLSIADYHRYHLPMSGIVREVRKTPGHTWVNEIRKPDGSLENIDDVGFQFKHTRGHIILESVAGLVAVMPVGMGHISSVNITAEEGVSLVKGAEFGYFGFGGSDIIMLFEAGRVQLIAQMDIHYKQGEKIGNVVI